MHHPLVNDVACELEAAIRQTGTLPYAERTHRGLVRYVQIAVDASTRAHVTIVANDTSPESSRALLAALRERLGPRLAGLWWNGHPERDNRVLGERFEHIFGARAFVEPLGGARVHFLPGAFVQSHLDLSHALVERIHAWVPFDAHVVELYAGAGAIGLGIAARGQRVTFNELGPASLESLQLGIDALGAEGSRRARVIPGPASSAGGAIGPGDTVIVDPPRKGLEPALCEALRGAPPRRLVYVACGLPAFLDDARALSDTLRLAEITAYDFFPHTEHLEVAALFERRSKPRLNP